MQDRETTIVVEGLPADHISIKLWNMFGQMVQGEFAGHFPGRLRHDVNLQGLAAGMYVVILKYQGRWTRWALVKY